MKWEAHTRTAQKILVDFDAYHFQKYEKDLINGIIYPDSNDPKPHRGREEAIKDYIRKARDRRLEYNSNDSFFYLGMAFHYIQDSWVGLDPDHEDYPKYQRLIDKSVILDRGEDLFKYYPVRRNRVLNQFKKLEKRLGNPVKSIDELVQLATMENPFESTAFLDLNFSYRICFRVAEMVLQPMLKVSLDEKIDMLHKEFTEKLRETEESEVENLYSLEEKLGDINDTGLINGIKRWNQSRLLGKRNLFYSKGKHLDKVFKEYERKTLDEAKPYQDWYNVNIPELVMPEKIMNEVRQMHVAMKRDDPIINY